MSTSIVTIRKSIVCRFMAGFAAIMLTLGILASCGGGGSSETEETVPDVPSAAPVSSTLSDDSQPAPSEGGDEQLAEEIPTEVPAETSAFAPPDLDTDLAANSEEVFGEALDELSKVVEDLLSEGNGMEPADIVVIVSDGEIVQGESRYEVALGESIIIEVSSSQFDHEVHVHGYDLTAFAGPITPARFEFVADLAGTWEVEFEATHELIFELAVR